MDVLILGGTRFLGRYLAQYALDRGHRVTLFHRGQSNPDLFATARHLIGDRETDLAALLGHRFDLVLDTSGYKPTAVRRSSELLADNAGFYVFVSSVSAYGSLARPGLSERGRRAGWEGGEEKVTGSSYGPMKAECERILEDVFPDRLLIVRPGLIAGPHDTTDRFPYWPRRFAAGGEILVPGLPGDPVQWIDVRDLAEWILDMAEAGRTGIYNAVGPEQMFTRAFFMDTCRKVVNDKVDLTWVAEAFLLDRDVSPWMELPLWVPAAMIGEGFLTVDSGKAQGAGLRFRPLAETIRDVLVWDRRRDPPEESKVLTAEKESRLLTAWRERAASP